MQRRSQRYPKQTVLRQIPKAVFTILRLRSFKVYSTFISKIFTDFYSKNIYQYSCLKAIKFLHYVITMPAFQADSVASTTVQFRRFIYQTLHETEN